MPTEPATTTTDTGEPWNKGRTKEEWAQWQSKYDAQQAQLNRMSRDFQAMQADSQRKDEQLAQYEILRRTEGMPEDQRTLTLWQEHARQAQAQAQAAQRAAQEAQQRENYVLGQAGRQLRAEQLIRTHGLPAKIETPDGEIDTADYLMGHRESTTVEGMTAVAARIAEKGKKAEGKAPTAKAATPPRPSSFLSGGGTGTGGGGPRKGVPNTLENRQRVQELMDAGYSYAVLAAKGYIPEGFNPGQRAK